MPSTNTGDLEQVRSNALQTVADYRHVVISLEVKRIAGSRVGAMMWEQHCWRLYPRTNHHLIVRVCRLIVNACFQIDFIFMRTAATNQVLFDRMVTLINGARSVARISALLQLMERNLILNSGVGDQGKICSHYNTASKT